MAKSIAITADSRPDYDGWGRDTYWGCTDWIRWWAALARKYSPREADEVFISAWLDGVSIMGGGRGRAPGSGLVFDSVPLSCRTVSSQFQTFLVRRPAIREAIYSNLGGVVAKPLAILNKLGDAADSIATTVSQNPIPTALVVGGGILLWAAGPPKALRRPKRAPFRAAKPT